MSDEAVAPLTATIKLPGANAPWIVIRSDNSAQLDAQLNELMHNGTAATLGRAQAMMDAQFTTGKGLDARAVDAPQDSGAFAQQAQAAGVYVQNQTQAAPPQQQAPVQQYQPQPQQQQYAPPAPAQQYAPPPQQQYTPGAPLVQGVPAKLISGEKNGRKWQAWADPRPKNVTDGMERTDDPNHPGLNAGTHSLFKFIR